MVLLLGPSFEEVEEFRHEDVPILEDLSSFNLARSDLVDEIAQHKIELLKCVDFFRLEVVDDDEGRADHDAVGEQDLEVLRADGAATDFEQEYLEVPLLVGRSPNVDAGALLPAELDSRGGT